MIFISNHITTDYSNAQRDAMMLWFELRNVLYLRKSTKDENFNNVPYYDEQEKEFWETHRITRNGIKKLTAFGEKEGDKVVV